MEITHETNKVIVKDLQDFKPRHVFECGQCFRWDLEEDGSYTGVAFGRVINVKEEDNTVIFHNTNIEDFNNIWMNYFDLTTDYGEIKDYLNENDDIIKEAIIFGQGIRILKQDPWETLISFIISANNGIPRIKKSIELMSKNFGQYIGEYKGKDYYSFPSPEEIYNLSEEQLKECKVGYRSKYILDTAKKIIDENISLNEIKELNNEDSFKEIQKFTGVGPKVANCILMFALEKVEAFPVDVWVKRIMEYLYFHKETSNKKIENFAEEKYGKYAGYAQQYLFYYARELGIGRK